MQPIGKNRLSAKKLCGLLFCIGGLFVGAVCCGRVPALPYSQSFSLSSGQCQGSNATPAAGEATLTVVASNGPNITICILRASDGTLLRYYDLGVHGDIVGHGDGLLLVNERGGDQGDSFALCAVRVSDGIERWCQTQLTNMNVATVSNGTIYASSGDQTVVAAVNERDGRILWHFQTEPDPDYSMRPPIVVGYGAVYANTYQSAQNGTATPGSDGTGQAAGTRSVCALRASNGQQLWCRSLSNQVIESMAVDENALYVQIMNDSSIIALNPADGSVRWRAPIPISSSSYGPTFFIAAHGMIFVNRPEADRSTLYALRASDGKFLWSRSYTSAIAFMAATDQSLYVVMTSGALLTLNPSDGAPAWSHGALTSSSSGSCGTKTCGIAVGHTVTYLFLSPDGEGSPASLLALRTSDGTKLWQDQGCILTPGVNASKPIPSASPGNGRCYWISHQGSANPYVRLLLIDDQESGLV
jgi:outer membrane protein assembly factor BamB